MSNGTLLVEKGARRVERNELAKVETPDPTSTWHPLSHSHVVDVVQSNLLNMGFTVKGEEYALAKDDAQLFGTLDLESPIVEGVSLSVGIANSTDKSISAKFCAGERVLVCSNLAFFSEVQIAAKHSVNVERRLNERVLTAVASLRPYCTAAQARIEQLQHRTLQRNEADSIILRAFEKKVVKARSLPKLIAEWRKPSHEEFETRTAWSLFNCYTEVLKDRQRQQPLAAAQETMAFQKLLCS